MRGIERPSKLARLRHARRNVSWTSGLVKDLCLTANLRESEVSFMDLNQERLDIVHSLAVGYADELGTKLRFEKTQNREAAHESPMCTAPRRAGKYLSPPAPGDAYAA